MAEAGVAEDLGEALLPRLRAEREAALFRQRMRAAKRRRTGVVDAANDVQVVFHPVARERLDQHDAAIVAEGFTRAPGRAHGIPEIMEAIEEADQIETTIGERFRVCQLELDAIGD